MENKYISLAERFRRAGQSSGSNLLVLDVEAAAGQAIQRLIDDGALIHLSVAEALLDDPYRFPPDGSFVTTDQWALLWCVAAHDIQVSHAESLPPLLLFAEWRSANTWRQRAEQSAVVCDWLADVIRSAGVDSAAIAHDSLVGPQVSAVVPYIPPNTDAEPDEPAPNGKPVVGIEEALDRFTLASGDETTGKIMVIADRTDLTSEQKMRLIAALDQRWKEANSTKWGRLLNVAAAAIRQNDAWDEWREFRPGSE